MMHRRPIAPLPRLVAGLLLILVSSAPVHALSVVQRGFDELVTLADLVVVGTVSAQHSAYDEGSLREGISTYITLTDLEVVKGALTEPTYTLRVAGGRLDDRVESYPGLPQLRTGERYVLFVRGNFRDIFPVVGVHQGVYRVLRDGAGRERVAPIDGHADAARALGPADESLAGFLQRVRAKLRETSR